MQGAYMPASRVFSSNADRSYAAVFYFTLAVALASGFLFFSADALAERTVTIDEAYQMAIATHEAVKIAGEGLYQAGTNLDKATSRLLPNVTAEGSYTRYSEKKMSGSFVIQPDDNYKANLKVTQSLYSGGREWSTRRQAKILIDKSREGLDESKENIIRTTAGAYFGVLKAQKDIEIKKAALNRAEERSKVAQARFRVGEVTKSAVLRAEAETAGAEAELTKAKGNLIDARNFLKRVIGIAEEPIVIEPEIQKPIETDIEGFVKRSYESRRDYKQTVLDEKVASEGITYAKGNFLPSLRLEGQYSYMEQDPKTTFFQRDSLSASLVLSYPIFEGGLRRAELSEANSKYRESELRRLQLKRDIEIEVREAYNSMESVSAVIDSYRKQLSFAEEDYKMVFEQFKYGLATTVDVIDADTTLISAQRSLMNATYDFELAKLELKYRAGVLMDEVMRQGIK